MFVGRANLIIYGQECLDLAQHYHVQPLVGQRTGLISLHLIILSAKQRVAVPCTPVTSCKKLH